MGPVTSTCCNDRHSPSETHKSQLKKKKTIKYKYYAQGNEPDQIIITQSPPNTLSTKLTPPTKGSYEQLQSPTILGDSLQAIQKMLKNPQNKKMKWSDFIIHFLIGTGGFGQVFLGELKQNKERGVVQRYAIKRMKKAFVIKKKLEQSIRLQKKILQESSCDFITRLFYAFRDEYYLYIVMEWAEGGDTYTLIRNSSPRVKMYQGLGQEAIRFIIACLILGLEYLHEKNIIYRDLKPQNLLIFKDGYVKLTDFGLAREIKENQGTKTLAGTTVYYAPEMVLGQEYGRQIDLWTLGVYSYEMSNLSAPFAGGDLGNKAKVQKLVQSAQNRRQWKNPGLSNELKSFINDLLKFNPSQRLGAKSWKDVKNHKFFTSVSFNWQQLKQRKMKSPLIQILRKHKIDYKEYDAAKMNPDLKLLLHDGGNSMLPSWSCRASYKYKS